MQDTSDNTITGSAAINVLPASANHLLITAPPTAIAGASFTMTVTALDPYGNVDTGYSGTVILISSDHNLRPSEYTFSQTDSGSHVFGVSLFTAGIQSISVRDAANGAITATASVAVQAAPADHFVMIAPATAFSGMPFDLIVAALDPYGNFDMNYQGTVSFSSSDTDPGLVLPAAYTFSVGSGGDNGVHDFLAGVRLITPGDQTLTAVDTGNGVITGSATVTVSPPPTPPPGGGANGPRKPTVVMESGRAGSNQQVALLDQLFGSLRELDSGVGSPLLKHSRADDVDRWVLDLSEPS